MLRKVICRALLGAAGLLVATGAIAQPGVTLEVVPSAASVATGNSMTVDVVVSGLGNLSTPSLGTYDLVLTYDGSLFSETGISVSPNLGDLGAAEAIASTSSGPGTASVFEVSLLSPAMLNAQQADTFTLFTVSFDAIAAGTSSFAVSLNAPLGDENGAALNLAGNIPADVTVTPGAADIPTLPPWGFLLLAAALLAAAFWQLRAAS